MTAFYKTIRAVLQPVVRVMYRIDCKGIENVSESGALMLCCNHTSMLDLPLLIALCPREICFMAKKELFKNPVLAWIFKKMGAFPVDRGGRDIASIRHSLSIVEQGKVFGIFPEGTRHKNGPMREVKAGCAFIAVKTSVDVLPVSIYKSGKSHIFRRVTVRFGELIKTEQICEGKTSKESNALMTDEIFKRITGLWELKY